MLRRSIHHKYCSESGRRWLSSFTARNSSCTARNPSSPAPSLTPEISISEQKPPFLGLSAKQGFVRYASPSLSLLKNPYNMKRCWFSSHAMVDLPVGGMVDVPLAQTGEGIAECELLQWFVQEGDQVDDFQRLCEVQSDKATMEITSRYKGRVAQILYVPGDIVKVGETLLKMVVEESQVPLPTSGALDHKSVASELCDSHGQISVVKESTTGGVLSTPPVRNLAKQYGINMNDVHGTGKDERVLQEDVLKYAVHKGIVKESSVSSCSSSAEEFVGGTDGFSYALDADGWKYVDKRVPLRGFQRTMVKTMTMAAQIPHFHYVEEIKCNALMKLKAAFQNENSDPEVKYTFLPLLIKSLSMAMSKYPLLNSCFNQESQEIIIKGSHNIGIAMATPHGLVVPNIKKVQSLSILEITKELSRLQQLALNNKLSPEDICGGTITLSNIGAIGGKFGSPLLNLPEVSIIAIGRIQKVPHFADDGNVYPASVMNVNIGADHRVLDGATVARFCNEWKLYIEKPELLMLHMR